MRTSGPRRLALPLLLIGFSPVALRAADAPELKGTYKFVIVSPLQDNEFFLLDFQPHGGQLDVTTKATPPVPGPKPAVTKAEQKGDKITLTVQLGGNDNTFRGQVGKEGTVSGLLRLQGNALPARLEKTDDKELGRGNDQVLIRSFLAARGEKDPKAKAEKFEALLKGNAGNPALDIVRGELLQSAEAAELKPEQVRKIVEDWIATAKPYGDEWVAEARARALKTLAGKAPYAELTYSLATEADKALGEDAATETRAEVTRALADAAKALGKQDVAARAEEKARGLEAKLDEEYHKSVPPFKPETAARKDPKTDRVVLMELFTGAQCPPCVAADVAFDALGETYKPSELITLQYHLHIPAPDPLTNTASEARQEYYRAEVRGTPSVFFNGKSDFGAKLKAGGGPMGNSQTKYGEYRSVIDELLEGSKQATIDLNVGRAGDQIKITAEAKADPGALKKDAEKPAAKATAKDNPKAEDEKLGNAGPQLRLRLVLVEEQVRYVGGNKLRFHHHVVRAMPGGPEGKALANGQGRVEQTVQLADVRKAIDEYVSTFVKENGSFPNPLPAVELKDLAVVAYVQDDTDHRVLHAVLVPVRDGK